MRRTGSEASLRQAWESQAKNWISWARAPMHDSYWRFHRDQFLELVPAPGRLTLDIGAGEGRLARHLSARGHRVVAIDASYPMLLASRQAEARIPVVQADAARLPLDARVADLAVAFMSLQDVDDMPAAIAEAGRVLVAGGRLLIAVVHPLNSAGTFSGDSPDDPFVIAGSYLEPSRYEDQVERAGLRMSFVSDHRPLEVYTEALHAGGFLLERLREPAVPEHAIREPRDRRWQRIPLFAHLLAIRQ